MRDALTGQYHFDPSTYEEMIRAEIPVYDEFQDVAARGGRNRGPLDPGARDRHRGDGATAARAPPRRRRLSASTRATQMLAVAREALPADRARCGSAASRSRCPRASSIWWRARSACITWTARASVTCSSACGGGWPPAGASWSPTSSCPPIRPMQLTELTPGFDLPDTVEDQLTWTHRRGSRPSWSGAGRTLP